jgi:hypothetical protein
MSDIVLYALLACGRGITQFLVCQATLYVLSLCLLYADPEYILSVAGVQTRTSSWLFS